MLPRNVLKLCSVNKRSMTLDPCSKSAFETSPNSPILTAAVNEQAVRHAALNRRALRVYDTPV